ncbi:substrate-binding domain-containing protein [uncultured Traorella sp.]|uniref:substrate-binding domain-containing protein n=1 Tax=uncultured Traorella sp. TaxID=1929048 RepID=UPI0025F28D1F|nr:substrate-binding domain-containing protein [uncultured Traorella sp.]
MKKLLKGIVAAFMVMSVAACSNNASDDTIHVLTREQGSGTRGAFIELFGIEQEDENGEKVDHTTETAEETNSTSVMLTTVQGDPNAIGYVSLGSLNDKVKAVKIDGAVASVDTVKDGSYKVSRPFNIVTGENLSDLASDFITYIMSAQGQEVIEEEGYISEGNQGDYTAPQGLSGTITVAGSSSVTPVMEKLAEAYKVLNPDVQIDVQQSDSTTGVNNAIEGLCDIGMASRELKDSELASGVKGTKICIDGIAVIVNNDNSLENLTSDQVMKIFTGEITSFSEVK